MKNKKRENKGIKRYVARSGSVVGMCLVLVCALVACGGTANTVEEKNSVHMSNVDFAKTSITIKKGESVTLVADTMVPHIIANGTWEEGKAKAAREEGAPEIKEQQIAGGSSGQVGPFNTAGTFQLYCTIHAGMKLTVIVQ